MIDLNDIQAVSDLAKRYLAERKTYERISQRSHNAQTPKQAQKANADLNWAAMNLLKVEAQLHTACVDAGLADLRDERHYAPREFRPSGWHTYTWTPPAPRSLAKASAA